MIWVRALDTLKARPLPGTEGAAQLFWSPDSRYIGFAHAGLGGPGKLFKIAVSGGPPHELADTGPGRAAWSSRGVILFTAGGRRLLQVSENGGAPTPVTKLDESRQEILHGWPVFLPDGKRFIFLAVSRTAANNALFLGSLDSPERTHLVDALSSAEYGSGHLVFQRDGTLMGQPFDEQAGRLIGDAIPLVDHVQYNANSGRMGVSVSQAGSLVYRTGASDLSRLTWLDPEGRAIGTVGAEGFYFDASLSPDGRWIAVTRTDQATGPGDLWLIDAERGTPTRLTSDRGDDNLPVWSPDSSYIVFRSNRKGQFDLYRRTAGGAAAEELLLESPDAKTPTAVSSDGKLLFFHRQMGNQRFDMWALPMTGDRRPFEVVATDHAEAAASLSPDGKWLLYDSDDEGGQVYVQPFPGKGRRVRVSPNGGFAPKWLADGKRIVYVTFERRFMAVDLMISGGEIRSTTARELFRHSTRRETSRLVRDFTVDPLGRRFLVAAPAEEGEGESPLYVVLNWPAALGQRR